MPGRRLPSPEAAADYVKPVEVVKAMLETGAAKAGLPVKDLLIRGFLAGSLLGFASSLALTAAIETGQPLAGALVFPVGFVMIVLLGLELVTGSFTLVPLAAMNGRTGWRAAFSYFAWVFLGNLAGGLAYGCLLWAALTDFGAVAAPALALKIAAMAEAKTSGYSSHGMAGWATALVRGILGNWMVCLGVVMAMTSRSTAGKIAAGWLPILTFFAQGFEHSVVNMFLIPAGLMFGAKTSVGAWWFWNQIPVTLGNLAGGLLFVALPFARTHRPAPAAAADPDVMFDEYNSSFR